MIKFVNQLKSSEILIYDDIGFFGITAEGFIDEIKQLNAPIVVRINSGGGSVLDGIAIHNAIARLDDVQIHIDGVAASIASYIAMAGGKVIMAENAFMMIHNPLSLAGGDAKDLRRSADLLDSMRDVLVSGYVEKSGQDEEKIIDMMAEETWLSAQEALDMGFVDEIGGSVEMAASSGEFPQHDFRNYSKFEALRNVEVIDHEKTKENTTEEINPMDEIKAELLAEQNQLLSQELDLVKEQLAKTEHDAIVASTRLALEDTLAAAKDLPELCKAVVRKSYDNAENLDGIDAAISEQSELVAELKKHISGQNEVSEVADLGPTGQAVNENEMSRELQIEQHMQENPSASYRDALLATAKNMEG